jgi:hypothetical protein
MQGYMMFHVKQKPKKPIGRPRQGEKIRRHVYLSKELTEVLLSKIPDGEISSFTEAALRMACGSRGWKVPPASVSI